METEKQVQDSVGFFIRTKVIAVLVFLLLALFMSLIFLKNLWHQKKSDQSAQNKEEVIKKMDTLWEEREYYRFVACCDANIAGNFSSGEFVKYSPLYQTASCFEQINDHCMTLFISGANADEEEELKSISKLLAKFYDADAYFMTLTGEKDVSWAKDRIAEIYHFMDEILITYFNLSEDEVTCIGTNRETGEILKLLEGGIERGKEKQY